MSTNVSKISRVAGMVILVGLGGIPVCACSSSDVIGLLSGQDVADVNCIYGISKEEVYGGIVIGTAEDDFSKFEFGDSLDFVFSNGYMLEDIPYYNGYYVHLNKPVCVMYQGKTNPVVKLNCGGSLWDFAGVAENTTVQIDINEKGKYKETQDAMDLVYSTNRADYDSDDVFANFREVKFNVIKENCLYRSASPVNNKYGRAGYVNNLMSLNGINYVMDLGDTQDSFETNLLDSKNNGVDVGFVELLYNSQNVDTLGLSNGYVLPEYAEKVAAGFKNMAQKDGPYLIHCDEGKDRTGFVCMLLEALSGATYEEMLNDYMKTYENYYGITRATNAVAYDLVRELYFDDMLVFLTDIDSRENILNADIAGAARQYLLRGGMTNNEIELLLSKIKK